MIRKLVVIYLYIFCLIVLAWIEAFDSPNGYYVWKWFMIKSSDLDINNDIWKDA